MNLLFLLSLRDQATYIFINKNYILSNQSWTKSLNHGYNIKNTNTFKKFFLLNPNHTLSRSDFFCRDTNAENKFAKKCGKRKEEDKKNIKIN